MKQDSASSTAYTVLQGLLHTATQAQYQQLVDQETQHTARQILQATEQGRKRLQQLDSRLSRQMLRIMETLLMPGISLHYALRKRYIMTQTRHCIAQGITQIINLGAGFDTLAWQLHQHYPDIQFIEIDHPATSKDKVAALQPRQSQNNLHFLAVDLAEQPLSQVLQQHDYFDPQRKTLFICEGVLMYLDQHIVSSLLQTLADFSPDCHFVFTAIAPMDSPDNNVPLLLKLYLKLKNEPLNWSLPPGKMQGFLEQHGYRQLDLADGPQMFQRFMQQPVNCPIHRGEYAIFSHHPINSQER